MSDSIVWMRAWFSVIFALLYVHTVVSRLPKSIPRLISAVPIISLFFALPFQFSYMFFRTISAFLFAWMSNFKIILFCFDSGPLVRHHHSLLSFLAFASLPISAIENKTAEKKKKNTYKNDALLVLKIVLGSLMMVVLAKVCATEFVQRHPELVPALYTLVMLLSLEVLLAAFAVPARAFLHAELEPQFDRPFASSSLGEFWGRRWNLSVPTLLRTSVYQPVRSAFSGVIGSGSARVLATMSTFVVSGLMHELVLYYMTFEPPTWEWTGFFVLHGVLTGGELVLKWAVGRHGQRVPRPVKILSTLTLLYVTAMWLFFPPVVRDGFKAKVADEFVWGSALLRRLLSFLKVSF